MRTVKFHLFNHVLSSLGVHNPREVGLLNVLQKLVCLLRELIREWLLLFLFSVDPSVVFSIFVAILLVFGQFSDCSPVYGGLQKQLVPQT